jgi:hypothetical protein
MPNTHVAFLDNRDGSAHRIAAGTEEHCRRILDERIAHGDRSGYVRPLTEDEVR